jgi:hypothetical protein
MTPADYGSLISFVLGGLALFLGVYLLALAIVMPLNIYNTAKHTLRAAKAAEASALQAEQAGTEILALRADLRTVRDEVVLLRRISATTRDLILGGQRPPTANDGQ